MLYLQQHTAIPTPKVFDWMCESDPKNPARVGYILMEKLDAKPLDWQAATSNQRETIMQQLADIFIEIRKHPFSKMGSLVPCDGHEATIRGIALPSAFQPGAGPLGPFASSSEGYKAIIESYLAMMASGEIDASVPMDVSVYHHFRLETLDRLWGDVSLDHQFFLKHPDDKGDHILVNDRYEIAGMIDWEWTATVSAAEAFCSPCMMWPVADFYEGSNELAPEERRLAAILREKGQDDLADHIVHGRKMQRFFFGLGLESSFLTKKEVADLLVGLQRALGYENVGWERWKEEFLKNGKEA